jgi:hypothetical protein
MTELSFRADSQPTSFCRPLGAISCHLYSSGVLSKRPFTNTNLPPIMPMSPSPLAPHQSSSSPLSCSSTRCPCGWSFLFEIRFLVFLSFFPCRDISFLFRPEPGPWRQCSSQFIWSNVTTANLQNIMITSGQDPRKASSR